MGFSATFCWDKVVHNRRQLYQSTEWLTLRYSGTAADLEPGVREVPGSIPAVDISFAFSSFGENVSYWRKRGCQTGVTDPRSVCSLWIILEQQGSIIRMKESYEWFDLRIACSLRIVLEHHIGASRKYHTNGSVHGMGVVCVSYWSNTGKYRIGVRERRSHAKGSNSHCALTLLSPQVGYEVLWFF